MVFGKVGMDLEWEIIMDFMALTIDAIKNGGGTYYITDYPNISGVRFDRVDRDFGYFVAKDGGVENFPGNTAILNAVIKTVWESRHFMSGLYLGLWRDDKGNWSIDETYFYTNREFAIETGKAENQRAIWDIENGTEIVL